MQWDCSSKAKTDKSTFLFSFNKKQKFIAKNKNNSIHCFEAHGPVFGDGNNPDIFFNGTLKEGESYKSTDDSNTFLKDRDLTNGEHNWEPKEIEVYKIVYI